MEGSSPHETHDDWGEFEPPALEERLAAIEERLGLSPAKAAPLDPVDELIESLARQAAADATMVPDTHLPNRPLVPLRQLAFHRHPGGVGGTPILVVPTHAEIEDAGQRRRTIAAELESRRDELASYISALPKPVEPSDDWSPSWPTEAR